MALKEISPCGDWKVELTDVARSDQRTSVLIPEGIALITLGSAKKFEIIGLSQDGNRATVQVKTYFDMSKSARSAELGKASVDLDQSCEADLPSNQITCVETHNSTRFDDGWRMD